MRFLSETLDLTRANRRWRQKRLIFSHRVDISRLSKKKKVLKRWWLFDRSSQPFPTLISLEEIYFPIKFDYSSLSPVSISTFNELFSLNFQSENFNSTNSNYITYGSAVHCQMYAQIITIVWTDVTLFRIFHNEKYDI